MPRTREADRSAIRAPSALAQPVYQEPYDAQVHLRAGRGESGALDGARVVTQAVAEAHDRGVLHREGPGLLIRLRLRGGRYVTPRASSAEG
jgi:hypothetical protein